MSFLSKLKNKVGKSSPKGSSGDGLSPKSKNLGESKDGSLPYMRIKMPGGTGKFVPLGRYQVKRIYEDDLGPRLLVIIDEFAELTGESGDKSAKGKAEDQMRQEIVAMVQSITQLGRAAAVHCLIATQRPQANIIPGVIQSNPLAIDTPVVSHPLVE